MNLTETNWPHRLQSAILVGTLLGPAFLIGCVSSLKTEPTHEPAALPSGQAMGLRSGEVQQRAGEFELLASELQTAQMSQQRPVMKRIFNSLVDLLPRFAGTRPSGVFTHQYSVVVQVRDQLASRPERLADEGLVDQGLLASYNVLRDLAFSSFYQDDQLNQKLDQLAKVIQEMQSSRDATHGLLVSDAAKLTGDAMAKMATIMHDRVTPAEGAASSTTQPSITQPSTVPATAPATAPVP